MVDLAQRNDGFLDVFGAHLIDAFLLQIARWIGIDVEPISFDQRSVGALRDWIVAARPDNRPLVKCGQPGPQPNLSKARR